MTSTMQAPTLTFVDDLTGITFVARLTGYASNGTQTVTVYDNRFRGERHPDMSGIDHTTLGQKVSLLPVGTVFRLAYKHTGWMMDSSILDWHLTATSIREIADWLLAVTF